jgi:hypothetical protein
VYLFALIVVPTFFLLLIEVSSSGKSVKKIPTILGVGFFFFVGICFTPLLIRDVVLSPTFEEKPGILYPVFVIYFLSWLCYGLAQMYRAFRESVGIKKNQLKYFLLALIIAFVAAVNYFASVFIESVPPIYHVIEILYSLLVAYAVIRYKVMEFNVLVRWSLARGALVAVCILTFLATLLATDRLAHYLSIDSKLPTLIAIMAMAAFYQTLLLKISGFIDEFIFKSPDLMHLMSGIEDVLQDSENLQIFAERLAEKLKTIWKVKHAGIMIWNSRDAKFLPLPQSEFQNEVISRIDRPITMGDFLVKTLETERRLFPYGVIFEDEITGLGQRAFPGERLTFWKIRRTMRWLGAAACVPIMSDERMIGFFILGNRNSGRLFNNEDKKVLSHLSQIITQATRNATMIPIQ